MCGRYTLTVDGREILTEFSVQGTLPGLEEWLRPRYNIAPGQPVVAIRTDRSGARIAGLLRWGLVPSWAKDPQIGYRMINARAETLAERPAFRAAYRQRRCLLPASGFYEWRRRGQKRQPYYFRLRKEPLFALAGLWEVWRGPDGQPLYSCTVVTTAANELVAPIHDRMPVILDREAAALWLEPGYDRAALEQLIGPYPASAMERYAVSPAVNAPAHDGPDCIDPIADDELPDPGEPSSPSSED
ncbi:MAG TPA: SOS response-associated peptidase [Limnochordia bacterium]